MTISAVLLDLDNTLIDRSAAHLRYCRWFTERFLTSWTPAARQNAIRQMVEMDRLGYTPREEFFQWLARRFGSAEMCPAELWHDYQTRLPLYCPPNKAVCEMVV